MVGSQLSKSYLVEDIQADELSRTVLHVAPPIPHIFQRTIFFFENLFHVHASHLYLNSKASKFSDWTTTSCILITLLCQLVILLSKFQTVKLSNEVLKNRF